ncbi:hypothetical protein BDZ89DRAFT_1078084 [Hymenopellis radicata]|nr:hypothetical protein BDZ89DRAFT_1078084 [Hymenopellis radicata]
MNPSHQHSPAIPSSTPPRGTILGLLRGRRSHELPAVVIGSSIEARPQPVPVVEPPTVVALSTARGPSHRIRLVPHLDTRRSLKFDPITRDLREGEPSLRIGRANAHSSASPQNIMPQPHPTSGKIAFKSKVVSRTHAEMWVDADGQFFVRDTRSSSGTFLNRQRLSPANDESPPKQVKDGDILQLGVDYQGGTEDIYKCVKMRVELGREWQDGRNAFKYTNIPDCCICLYPVTIRQALFIAPCSHTFHYKCLRPLLLNHPAFSCPLCRTFADLDEDVEIEVEESEEEIVLEEELEKDVKEKRERDAGAETEVETDQNGRSRLWPGMDLVADAEDQDVLMPHAMGMNDTVVQQVKYPYAPLPS